MCNSNCKTSEKSSSGACPLSPVRSRGAAIFRGAIFKILIGFGGSFSDKGAFPGRGGGCILINFMKVAQGIYEGELKLNVTSVISKQRY